MHALHTTTQRDVSPTWLTDAVDVLVAVLVMAAVLLL
jgi:hypothetical protein